MDAPTQKDPPNQSLLEKLLSKRKLSDSTDPRKEDEGVLEESTPRTPDKGSDEAESLQPKRISRADSRDPLFSVSDIIGWAWSLGYRIALPIVLFAFGGRLLDKKLGTSVVFLLIGIFLALGVSGWMVYKQIRELIKNQ